VLQLVFLPATGIAAANANVMQQLGLRERLQGN
jgi:hypothetical protein